jgi:hypothetical protein
MKEDGDDMGKNMDYNLLAKLFITHVYERIYEHIRVYILFKLRNTTNIYKTTDAVYLNKWITT